MRSPFWFLPAIAIPIMCLRLFSGQPSSTTTVDTSRKPLPPLTLLPQTTTVAPKANAPHPPTLEKKPPQKVIAQKHPPKAKTESTENKVNTRPYNAPAIEIRVEIAPARSQSFAQRNVLIPIEPNQMVTAEVVGSSLKLNYCGLSRAIGLCCKNLVKTENPCGRS
ncbi:hypothetical protein [Synechocystis sp. PCC 7509]|uniref:hypothetical protein n=1 Tax=Synechocystis sp. PCC 7509 TaxID=927677 RepID=UPI0002ACEA99|nr:hypothetical protein [Synechocystis sp. PCC 7509]